MEEIRYVHKTLAGKPDGKRPLKTPGRRWEDNIKIYLREIGLANVHSIHMAEDRDRWRAFVNTVMNLWVS
jgi:hypothetical protein